MYRRTEYWKRLPLKWLITMTKTVGDVRLNASEQYLKDIKRHHHFDMQIFNTPKSPDQCTNHRCSGFWRHIIWSPNNFDRCLFRINYVSRGMLSFTCCCWNVLCSVHLRSTTRAYSMRHHSLEGIVISNSQPKCNAGFTTSHTKTIRK